MKDGRRIVDDTNYKEYEGYLLMNIWDGRVTILTK